MPSDDEMAIIKSILLSEQRLQIASLRRLLAELEARGEAARVEWGAELAQVAGKIATELEREQAEIDQHRQRLAALRAALEELARLVPHSPEETVAQIKPLMGELVGQAIHERRDEMAEALGPVMGEAIRVQIRDSRQEMVESLYPVIGSTIQRALAEFMLELQRNFDARLNNTFGPEGVLRLAWARLRGVNPGVLALRQAMPFQLRGLFVIQHGSGLLMGQHVPVADDITDADLISGMLTAIRDFVQDSFGRGDEDEELDEVQYGDQRIIIGDGPTVYVAAVLMGVEPEGFRARLHELVAELHVRHGAALRRYMGDPATMPALKPMLETFHTTLPDATTVGAPPLSRQQRLALFGGGVILLLLLFGACFYLYFTIKLWPFAFPQPTPTLMPSPTVTVTPSPNPTATATTTTTPTATNTPTWTPTPSPTPTPTPTATATRRPTATRPPSTNTPVVLVTTGNVWSRTQPSLDAPLFRAIPVNTPVTVLDRTENWAQLEWWDVGRQWQGWVPAQWFGVVTPAIP